jgi:hypothetical protein
VGSIQSDSIQMPRQLRVVPPTPKSEPAALPVKPSRISVKSASRHVGAFVRIVTNDEREHVGEILEADGNSILLETHLSAGTFSYELSAREIDTVTVLRR